METHILIIYISLLALVIMSMISMWITAKVLEDDHERFLKLVKYIQEVLNTDDQMNRHVKEVIDNDEQVLRRLDDVIFHLKKGNRQIDDDGK